MGKIKFPGNRGECAGSIFSGNFDFLAHGFSQYYCANPILMGKIKFPGNCGEFAGNIFPREHVSGKQGLNRIASTGVLVYVLLAKTHSFSRGRPVFALRVFPERAVGGNRARKPPFRVVPLAASHRSGVAGRSPPHVPRGRASRYCSVGTGRRVRARSRRSP